jgi:copper homeostasis protein
MTMRVEICIDAPNATAVTRRVSAAYRGGADTVELCHDMAAQGLTPAAGCIAAARLAFGARPGLMVMIRPRGGDFAYTRHELAQMQEQIAQAAQAGADGVVFGAVRNGVLDESAMARLVQTAQAHGLLVTCHRAFDATHEPLATLEILQQLGVQRVLTSGTPWGTAGTVLDGLTVLTQLIAQAGPQMELVLGGGVQRSLVPLLAQRLPLSGGRVALHCYSGVLVNGETDETAVAQLVTAVTQARP